MLFRPQFALAALLCSLAPIVPLRAQNAPAENHNTSAPPSMHATSGPGTSAKNRPLLPAAFDGRPRAGDITIDPNPLTADAAHAELLKEDGMVEASVARYAGPGQHSWTVQAIRFGDVTGAFAAFTFYRSPDMRSQPVGDAAAASPGVFLVQRGAMLLIARNASGAGSAPAGLLPEIRVLVRGLPRVYGPSAIPPPLPALLPKRGLDATSLHYAIGPVGYNGPLPASVLGFNSAAEVATAAYPRRDGHAAVLTLDMLPTPELAETSLRAVSGLPDASLHVGVRRLGPLVAVVSGAGVTAAAARSLLASVRYAPGLILDVAPPKPSNQVAKTAQLLVAVAGFTGVMAVAAVLLAAFFGFGRVWIRRLQGKPDSSLNDDTFITLHLK